MRSVYAWPPPAVAPPVGAPRRLPEPGGAPPSAVRRCTARLGRRLQPSPPRLTVAVGRRTETPPETPRSPAGGARGRTPPPPPRRRRHRCAVGARHRGSGRRLAGVPHLGGELEGAPDVGARRAADVLARGPPDQAHGGDRRRVGHGHHAVDDGPGGTRLPPGTADAFDARAQPGRGAQVVCDPTGEEGRPLGIDHDQAGGVAAVAQVSTDGGGRAAGAGSDDDPGGDRRATMSRPSCGCCCAARLRRSAARPRPGPTRT